MLPTALRLQIVCHRCKKPTDITINMPCGRTDPCTAEEACPVCKQELALRVAPSICHVGEPIIAHVLGVGCYPTQLLRSDFWASCEDCTESMRIREVGPGFQKRAGCTKCFAKLNLAVKGSDLNGMAVNHWRLVADHESERIAARRHMQDSRRRERQDFGIRSGQPLPNNGTCKHFHKSFRWFRFPCCGRAFPCGVCHDEQCDHPHENAKQMLCGHCAFEQPATSEQCTKCGAAQTRAKSTHWEGGAGCRNVVAMSKGDAQKYRGLGKTVSRKAASTRQPKSGN